MTPAELPPTPWAFTLDGARPGEDLVAVGGDLAPATLVNAYAAGLFPMGLGHGGGGEIGWWSPDPRAILRPGDFRASRSLRRSERDLRLSVDTDFDAVVVGCADPGRPHGWITPAIRRAYGELHRLGWAHSVEVWVGDELVGGLYGVAVGGLFAAESKFHRRTDASKAAVHGLCAWWLDTAEGEGRLVDVQWQTAHLASLGVREVQRQEYTALLRRALDRPGGRPPDFPATLSEHGLRT